MLMLILRVSSQQQSANTENRYRQPVSTGIASCESGTRMLPVVEPERVEGNKLNVKFEKKGKNSEFSKC